jgi:NAD(P)-dependent dehydrogenase (short-subunit alcohol dehydrogenase family)
MKDLQDRTAVVIGGGGGIGRGISLGLAAEGMHVVVADIEPETAAGVAAEIGERGGSAVSHRVDATSRASLGELAAFATDRFGGVHVLSNNVGVITDRRLDAASDADWAWFLEFNIMAIARGVDEFLPFLRAHGEPSHIVNTSSMAGLLVLPPETTGGVHTGLYTTTKHALIGYCAMLRAELAPEGIGVSALCPGVVVGNLAATSARNRPERFGGPAGAIPDATPMPFMMPNEEVGPKVVNGIRANRLHIFTHGDGYIADMLRDRFEAMMADFDAAANDPVVP